MGCFDLQQSGYLWLILPILTSDFTSFRSDTMISSASRTKSVLYAPASDVNLTRSSMGQNISMLRRWAICMSSSPLAGARCTRPVPASTSTNDSATAIWYVPLDMRLSSSGILCSSGCVYRLPSNTEPGTTLTISYPVMFISSMNVSNRRCAITHSSSYLCMCTIQYISSGWSPTMASVTKVNGIVVHTTRCISSSTNFTL